jgi:DNA-binding IclR family transcriptional regulator
MEHRATSYRSQGLERALAALRRLGAATEPVSLADLAAGLDLPKPTLLRLLAVLEEQGFVHREGTPPTYSIGHAVLEISEPYRRRVDAAAVAAPFLGDLAARTGFTTNVGVLEGPWVLHLCVEEPDRPLRFRSSSGSLDHAHCTALGKLLLAQFDPEQLAVRLPAAPYPRFTPATITTRNALLAELDRIRATGVGLDDQERDPGVVCLAVGVPLPGGGVALSVSGPAAELGAGTRAHLIGELRRTAGALAADRRFAAALATERRVPARTEQAS